MLVLVIALKNLRWLMVDQEDKIKELEGELAEMKKSFCNLSFCILPMYREWQENHEQDVFVTRMILDG